MPSRRHPLLRLIACGTLGALSPACAAVGFQHGYDAAPRGELSPRARISRALGEITFLGFRLGGHHDTYVLHGEALDLRVQPSPAGEQILAVGPGVPVLPVVLLSPDEAPGPTPLRVALIPERVRAPAAIRLSEVHVHLPGGQCLRPVRWGAGAAWHGAELDPDVLFPLEEGLPLWIVLDAGTGTPAFEVVVPLPTSAGAGNEVLELPFRRSRRLFYGFTYTL